MCWKLCGAVWVDCRVGCLTAGCFLCVASIQLVALSLCSVSLHCWTASPPSPGNPPYLYPLPQASLALSACRLGWLWLHYLWIFMPHSPHTQPFEMSTSHWESEKYSHHIPTSCNITFTPCLQLCTRSFWGRVCASNESVNLVFKKKTVCVFPYTHCWVCLWIIAEAVGVWWVHAAV